MWTANDMVVSSNDVLVLAYSLDVGNAAELRLVLDDAERLRADGFVSDVDRRRFTVAHAATRFALGHLLRRSPKSLKFMNGAHGKPRLADPDLDIRFNLSHAHSRALIAVARGREVGVDIEEERPIELLEVARLCFSAKERDALLSFSEKERLHAFFRGWTRKESFIKAHGRGLSYPLASFEVSLDESGDNVVVACSSAPAVSERGWETRSLRAEKGFAAAITAEGTEWRSITRETSIDALQELGNGY